MEKQSKGALIGAAHSTCIRMEKDSRAASVKLQIEVVNGRLQRWVEALVCDKGLPCLQIRVGSVTKALQSPLDVFSWNAKFPQFSGTNSVVQTNVLFLLHGALATNTVDNRGLLTISRYMWCHLDVVLVFLQLAIAFERALFPGLTTGCLTVFFSFFVDLKEQWRSPLYCITWLK